MSDLTIELLGAAMRGRGCPVCSVVRGLAFDELCQLQQQAVVDPNTHADVVARGGYCAEHFWCLDQLTSPVTNASLLALLMERLSERIAAVAVEVGAGGDVLRQDAAEIADRLGAPRACRVCDRVVLWVQSAIASLLVIIREPARLEQYQRSDGLCLPHLARALSACGDRVPAEQLLRAAHEQARRLAADLTSYVRKREQRDRSWGAEEAAPHAAIEKLVGGQQRGR